MSHAVPDKSGPTLVDGWVAAGAGVVLVLLTAIATEEGARELDVGGYALAVVIGIVLYWRRTRPGLVAVVSLAFLFGYHAFGYPAVGSLPLAFALANASYYGNTRTAVAVASVAVLGALAWLLLGENRVLSASINLVIRDGVVLAAAVLLGSVLRSRSQLAEESRQRARLARAEQDARMTEERMTIAREIHDVLAHTVTLIGVQTKVAMEAADDSPGEVRAALQAIRESTDNAAAEVRATIGVLRTAPSLDPAPGLDQLDPLVDSMSTSDLAIELTWSGKKRDVSDLVGLVAYRVVQESLTNVVKHSSASKVDVEIRYRPTELEVSVIDDGGGGTLDSGFGLAGMRERVGSISGNLSVDEPVSGGVRVVARLPTGARR